MRRMQGALDPTRIRTPEASFAFVPHRFLRGGFWQSCSLWELVAYFFLVLVSDRHGMSFYGLDKAAGMCRMPRAKLEAVLACLTGKDLIARDGSLVQVLSLPETPARMAEARRSEGPVPAAEAFHAFTLKLLEKKP